MTDRQHFAFDVLWMGSALAVFILLAKWLVHSLVVQRWSFDVF